MARFTQESVRVALEALGIPFQDELEEITERLNGYVSHLEELRKLPLAGIYPLELPPIPGTTDA